MKNLILLLITGVFGIMVLCSASDDDYNSGFPGATGSPGEETCGASGCHATAGGTIVVTLENSNPFTSYVPGITYNLKATVARAGTHLFGLGLEALRSTSANAGTLIPGNDLQLVQASNSRNNLVQNAGGTAEVNSKEYLFQWTAPATNVGDVTFFYSGVATDAPGTDPGDFWNAGSLVVVPAPVDCNGVSGGTALPGTPCNDNDVCTNNDVYTGTAPNCGCSGTPDNTDTDGDGVPNCSDNCPTVAGQQGSDCDDGIVCTTDDALNASCVCTGTVNNTDTDGDGVPNCSDNCPTVAGQIGSTCNDGNDCTINDVLNGACQCAGTASGDTDGDGICNAQDDCPNVFGEFGSECDDAIACSVNDQLNGLCQCVGTATGDADGDGICDGADQCPDFFGQIGSTCDDGVECTIQDAVTVDCYCAGIATGDLDGDGVCDAVDNCPNVSGQIGDPCDDSNADTGNDVLRPDCQCLGDVIDCFGVPGGPDYPGALCDDDNALTTGDTYTQGCVCQGIPTGSYCIPESFGDPLYGYWIDGVAIGSISNVGSGPVPPPFAYTDYSSQYSTGLSRTSQQLLTITPGPGNPTRCAAWIDYDHDGTFAADEKLGEFVSNSQSGHDIPFTVPATATLGSTILRVRAVYIFDGSDPDPLEPCFDYGYSEIEDYAVAINSNVPLDCENVPDGTAWPGTTCDDGLSSTGNDRWNANCVCTGQLIDCLGIPGGIALPGAPCDDGYSPSEPDIYLPSCLCAGNLIVDCLGQPDGPNQLYTPCDDGDPLTGDDTWNGVCQCIGLLIDCENVPGGPALPGVTCDDLDATTGNDVWHEGCLCYGEFIDCENVPGGPALPGVTCDDLDATTGNDIWHEGCLCYGELIDCENVPGGLALPGTACTDNDPDTGNDTWNTSCDCIGLTIDCLDVIGGTALPGVACDDQDPDTENDRWTADCVCVGDQTDCLGVLNGPDQPFSPCDDNLSTTGNDTWTGLCACEGQLIDCENVPGGTDLPGSVCDDDNACTIDEVWNASCVCEGVPVEATVAISGPMAVLGWWQSTYTATPVIGAVYEWTLPSGWIVVSSAFNQITVGTNNTPGPDSLCVSASLNGCELIDCIYVSLNVSIGIEEAQGRSNDWFMLIPNPSNGVFQLLPFSDLPSTRITVYDGTGRALKAPVFAAGKAAVPFDLSDVASGIYYLRATSEGEQRSMKIMIER